MEYVLRLILSEDLMAVMKKYPEALQNFPESVRRGVPEWIRNAKRKETRERRIDQTARMAQKNERTNPYRKK